MKHSHSTALSPRHLVSLGIISLAMVPPALAADTNQVAEIVVTGRREGVPAYERAYGPTVIDAATLATAPQRRLDEALRAVPGFSLFRRSGSRTANPTAQGVSLRGIGPNGAGRTLVLVDGVPVNDPFGGWVYWSRLPTAAVDNVVLTRGGGAGPWGNAALAGTIRIETKQRDGLDLELAGGSNSTWMGQSSVGGSADGWHLGLSGSAFRTDGVNLVEPSRRGAIDIKANSDAYAVDGTLSTQLGSVTATAKLSGFKESRGNGTPYTNNSTDATEASLRLVGTGEKIDWEAVAYWRDWSFASTFSGVNGARTAETPSLDQYDVPATAKGGILQVAFSPADGHQTDIGADIRQTEGKTRELMTYSAGRYTRMRDAGGSQSVAGLFFEHAWTGIQGLTVSAGGRLDAWRNSDGRRIESDIASGTLLRNDRYAKRDGTVANGRAGIDWQASDLLGLRVAAYTGFRLPTLNELYRPFRVGNDITEANPGLQPERMRGVEAGLRLSPGAGITANVTLFHVRLKNAVDNVVIQTSPGTNAELGIFVPAGGSLAQRRGLPRVEVQGLEAEIGWQAAPTLRFGAAYLFSDSEITDPGTMAALRGNQLGQAPRHSGTVDVTWTPRPELTLRAQVRAAGKQFEDSRNLGTLDGFIVGDLYAAWRVDQQLEFYATAENVTGERVETGRRSDGLTNIGPERQWLAGVRVRL
ncbi:MULTISPECIES: TonB-dependent receptor [unclassified Azospirillum]|uniref:TonB-dependent receptor n=1 Tax=unclassified Azospirillum TaxID=2630922 RepID=UPI000B74EE19|nr:MULTISPECIES: TonB-dependent receptor [unclassified Azospirillum]SNS87722.1 Outer membrane cobalamin receptor protein [Azospirillum sp. RU38E]SNT04675.1 Outer membrane cobalamin receptor protein [Azospirillum sp. RU37A]